MVTREVNWKVLPVVRVSSEGDLNESGSGERVDSKMLSMENSSLGLPDDRLPHSGLQRVSAWRSLLPIPTMFQSPLSCFWLVPSTRYYLALCHRNHFILHYIIFSATLVYSMNYICSMAAKKEFQSLLLALKHITPPFLTTHGHFTFYKFLMTFRKEAIWLSLSWNCDHTTNLQPHSSFLWADLGWGLAVHS